MNKLGLYIHIPFCVSKCGYCDFYSIPYGLKSLSAAAKKESYLKSLDECLRMYARQAKNYTIDTVYIGGGTPSCINITSMAELVKNVYKLFRVNKKICEFTVELNPATYSYKEMKKLRKAGVNRISIGAQSIHNNELKELTRIYNSEELGEFIDGAKKAKFTNISVDVMYGIPNQTMQSLEETLGYFIRKEVQHISLYGLTIEAGTPFASDAEENLLSLPGEDAEREMYFNACEILERSGYAQYEISNFARQGFECRHNLKYWNCEEYIGIGPSAHSYFANKRFSFKKDIDVFTGGKQLEDNTALDEYFEILPRDRIGEYIMLRFRLKGGISCEEFYKRFGFDFEQHYIEKMMPFIFTGHIIKGGNGTFKLSREGMYVSNHILSTLIDFGPSEGKQKNERQ